ncbi:KAT8 regulatory NSL complex subunit 1-like protein isoform X3 [Betta splendens]|uniref:KAT8 regulatory NSL complex subunit 1-like protein isoform X3 n=1 Tax=Betta splendens TaxID=158456 RepID=A0A6P7LEP6_BETSP|nr:KAT8 regulatory NSL complex subunit 1-like protein isoform X3 [Betta splendens]
MAPALTRVLSDDHGVHLSSPAGSVTSASRGPAGPDPPLTLTEDLHKMWLNVSLFSALDSCAPVSLDAAAVPAYAQCEAGSPASPPSLLGLLSFNKGPSGSALSAAPDRPTGHGGREARLQLGCGDAPECGPGVADVHHSRPWSPTRTLGSRPPAEEALRGRLSRQARLRGRARGLQRRLAAALAEHAALHCERQLEALERRRRREDDGLGRVHPALPPPRAHGERGAPRSDLSTASPASTELRGFCRSTRAVLRTLQGCLDSDATGGSSSEGELEEEQSRTKRTLPASSSSCERRWLEERAELGSRWSWLQLRLAELEGRIQQVVELHKHICSSKSGVVLAEPQPHKDRRTPHNPMMEMGGLSCTATDADTEPCSPMRLLHNIERQSAQLSQIVNSLMPPLSFSPLSKQDRSSGQKADNGVMPGSSRRRTPGRRMLFKAHVSCVCARTRPLVAYRKPRLFTLNSHNPSSSQDSAQFKSSPSSSCPRCSSCDPVALCSDPDCSSSRTPSSRNPSSSSHQLPLSFDTAPSYHIQRRSVAREEWAQRPLVIDSQPSAPPHYNRRSSTPLRNSRKYKQRARRHKSNVMGLAPFERAGSARSQYRRAKQRKRKRKCIQQHIEDGERSLFHLWDLQESSDELLEASYTQASLKQASQGFVRKRQGESVYNIDNIVIPMSLAKVEKLQYKNILTPSWRMVESYSLADSKAQKEGDCGEGQVEDLSDGVFAQRHLALEQREKRRWSSWGKRTCCRRPTRSGSRLGTICTSGEESSVEWSSAQLDTDEQPSSDEWLPRAPWEPRMFPLDKDEALLSSSLERVPVGWSDSSAAFSASKNSKSHVSTVLSFGARLPSGEQA